MAFTGIFNTLQGLGYDVYKSVPALEATWEATIDCMPFYDTPHPTLFERIRARSHFAQAALISTACTLHDVGVTACYTIGSFWKGGTQKQVLRHFAKRSFCHALISGGCAMTAGLGVILPCWGGSAVLNFNILLNTAFDGIQYFLSPVYNERGVRVIQQVGTI